MRHNPAAGAITIMLRSLKMHGMAQAVSTPEQDCIAFRSKDASMMPTRMPSSMGLFGARQVGVGSSLGSSTFWRRERRLLWLSL